MFHRFASSCIALILLRLKHTIGIRLSPEEELRGLDWIAHGENWRLTEKPINGKLTTLTTKLSNIRSLASSNSNSLRENKVASRSRSKSKRRSQVRLRSDINQIRPAYSRSQSQLEQFNPQFQPTLPV